MNHEESAILEMKDIFVKFLTRYNTIYAVNGIDIKLKSSEILAIVGESGAGKSQMFSNMMGILATNGISSGEILFKGEDVFKNNLIKKIRGKKISMIFQDPSSALNPYLTIEQQMNEMLTVHEGYSYKVASEISENMLEQVHIPNPKKTLKSYSHQFSGGQKQRIMIAMSLLCNPDILIADEPTTALDVTIQEQILNLLMEMKSQKQMSIIFITHDLGIVERISDRVIVMYTGQIIEEASSEEIFANPLHPYTQGLLNSFPHLDMPFGKEMGTIPGNPPNLSLYPTNCTFHPRCEKKLDKCHNCLPKPIKVNDNHCVSCFLEDKNE